MGRVEPVERTGLRHLVPYSILLCVGLQTESAAILSSGELPAPLDQPFLLRTPASFLLVGYCPAPEGLAAP